MRSAPDIVVRPPTPTMWVCLRLMAGHPRLLPLLRRTGGYVLTEGRGGTLYGWFPEWAVDGLVARGMVEDGQLTRRGLIELERHLK